MSRPRKQPTRRRRAVPLLVLLAVTAVATSGCSVPSWGFVPPITEQAERVYDLWRWSVVTALAVGILVWGMIFYACFAYRRRNDTIPRQVRYNVPIETLYTIVPIIVIASLFYYTARDEIFVNKLTPNPDVTVGVVAFRWNWQFNYTSDSQGLAQPLQVTGTPGQEAELVLPAHRTVRFIQTSPDVIHSFWIPDFLFKRDVIPGRINQFEVTINKTGTYVGRCAELCGVDHDRMNFKLKVVQPDEYASYIASLKAAQTTASAQATGSAQTTGSAA